MEKTIDILVPISGALENVKKCISSILQHTDLNRNRLILVADSNIDMTTKIYLDSLKAETIYKHFNKSEISFGVILSLRKRLSDADDIVILSPNAIVTPKWIEKIEICAYSDKQIGIVSPLTNSIINYEGKSNYLLTNDFDIDTYSERLEEISLYQYPVVPLADSNCIFIKKDVLDEILSPKLSKPISEVFTVEAFAERVYQLGYCHVLCDTAFIYCYKNDETEQLSPEFLEKWNNSLIKKNIEFYNDLDLNNGKKNIFYLVQADFREGCSNNIGGTQLHVKDLVMELKEEFNLFVAARDEEYLRVTAYINEKIIPLSFNIGPVPKYFVYRSDKLDKLFTDLLMAFRINLVHIHHTMGLTLELYYSAEKVDIPVYTTLHDYYAICPTLRLLDTDNKSCIGINDSNKCSKCLKNHMNISGDIDYIRKWRKEYRKVLEISEKIFIPSKAATNIILQYYPEIEGKVQIVPHGIDSQVFYQKGSVAPYRHKQLHIAFVGGICETKGSSIIYEIITKNPNEFEWFIFGGIGTNALHQLEQKNLTKTGWYQKEELRTLLDKYEIDIVCLLSMVEETYCYTLSEAVACGVPVIATNIGALGERVETMDCGWLVSPGITADALLRVLQQIQNDSLEYEKKYNITKEIKIRTNVQMADDYRNIYEKQMEGVAKYIPFNSMRILEGYLPAVHTENSDIQALASRNQYLEQELSVIYGSNIFRYMQRIAKFVDEIKEFLKFDKS